MAKLNKTTLESTYRKERGWGYELWLENNEQYCGKILHVKKGKRGSLHFHLQKNETMFLEEGRVDLLMVDPDSGSEYTVSLQPGDSIFVPRGQVHQIVALEDSNIIEFSTQHHESDSYRVRKGD